MNLSACLNPKLIISQHFDSIVRQIDIAVEEMVQKNRMLRLNTSRDEIIAEVRQTEQKIFELYETSLRAELRDDAKFQSLELDGNKEAYICYLKRKLFANNSIGFFRTSSKICLIKFDFYVDQSQVNNLQ